MKRISLIYLFLAFATMAWGQKERKVIREGLRAYKDGDFSEAEVQFRKAGDINQSSFEAEFNTGTALYGQQKYEETVKQYESLARQVSETVAENPETMAHIWHNMGNSLLEAQQYGPSIEAYKNSLRLNPDDYDTKYNLAYARQKLKEQQQEQQQQQENQDQEGENDPREENEDQQQEQENKPESQGEQNQDESMANEEQQDEQEQQQDQKDQQAQQEPREISKEDAERMLNAIQQQEKDVKDKVDKKKAAAAKVKTKKDW
jgi:tetratricopeptide (TPR) repeat protein